MCLIKLSLLIFNVLIVVLLSATIPRPYFGLMSAKPSDSDLFKKFFDVMYETGADFTNSFRKLSLLKFSLDKTETNMSEFLNLLIKECASIDDMRSFFKPKMPKETLDKLYAAAEENPGILEYFGLSEVFLRNQLKFIEKYEKLKDKTNEEKKQIDTELWSSWLHEYYNRIKEDFDAQSSDFGVKMAERIKIMNSHNPRFILRNHIVQEAIEKADKNDFTETKMLLKILENAFSEEPIEKILNNYDSEAVKEKSASKFYEAPPLPTKCVRLTCSS